MKADSLSSLIALQAVAKHRNFRLAANELRISPSAVSQAVKQLELKLGIALVARTTRSTRLTEAGEKFLSRCAPALSEIQAAMDDADEYASKPSGLLRLNVPRAAYPGAIAPRLAQFMHAYPEIKLELYFDDSLADIVAEGFDAGIRPPETLSKDMTAVTITKPFRYIIAVSPAYLKKFGTPQHPKDLANHSCILYRYSSGKFYDAWEFQSKKKEFTVSVKGSLIVNDPHAMTDASVKGLGLIYYTDEAIEQELKTGKLKLVLENYAIDEKGFQLYFPNRHQVLPKLRAFIDFMKQK